MASAQREPGDDPEGFELKPLHPTAQADSGEEDGGAGDGVSCLTVGTVSGILFSLCTLGKKF